MQWEYQVGPCTGIDGPDQLWMSRYLLYRIAGEGLSCCCCVMWQVVRTEKG